VSKRQEKIQPHPKKSSDKSRVPTFLPEIQELIEDGLYGPTNRPIEQSIRRQQYEEKYVSGSEQQPAFQDRTARIVHLALYRQIRQTVLSATGERALGEDHRAFRITYDTQSFYLEIDPPVKRLKLIQARIDQKSENETELARCELDARAGRDLQTGELVQPIVGYTNAELANKADWPPRRIGALSYLEINTPQTFKNAQGFVNHFEELVKEHPEALEILD